MSANIIRIMQEEEGANEQENQTESRDENTENNNENAENNNENAENNNENMDDSNPNEEDTESDALNIGTLQVNVVTSGYLKPIEGATVQIVFSGDPSESPQVTLTDSSGQTPLISLVTPPLSYSMEPHEYQPYSLYTVRVSAPGFIPIEISGIEIFPGQTAIQNVSMDDVGANNEEFETIVLPANTLYASYPPKIPEDEIKPIDETGEIVLSRVVIPEYIIVHDGAPTDTTARNYYVRYTDYIKNVASSEIYATWPDATLRANILAIQSFTLNRVYTEWSLRII